MAIPTNAWDETKPAGNRARSLGDDDIREFKTQVREVIAVDHEMESSGNDTDWGYHKAVHFLEQAASPSNVANTVMMYAMEEAVNSKAALYMQDEDGNEVQLTEGDDWIAGITNEIRMWSGSIATIPTGWVLCDGNNSTPDLRDSYVVGAKEDDGGTAKTNITGSLLASGGATTHYHSAGSLTGPNHTHTETAHAHYANGNSGTAGPAGSTYQIETGDEFGRYGSASHYHAISLTTTSNSGGNTAAGGTGAVGGNTGVVAATSLPTFYALAMIMKS